jgi:hypothetical protein
MEWVTVASGLNPIQANVIKSILEGDGIDVTLLDENLTSIQPFYGNALGGVKVQVQKKDSERASELIEELEK